MRVDAGVETVHWGFLDGKLKPVARLGGDEYSIVRDVVHLPRPRVVRAAGPGGAKGAGG